MALISCPECKKEISDQAMTCPNCGYAINKLAYQTVPEKKRKGLRIAGSIINMIASGIFMLLILLIIVVAVLELNNTETASSSNSADVVVNVESSLGLDASLMVSLIFVLAMCLSEVIVFVVSIMVLINKNYKKQFVMSIIALISSVLSLGIIVVVFADIMFLMLPVMSCIGSSLILYDSIANKNIECA